VNLSSRCAIYRAMSPKSASIIPGFGLSFGVSVAYISLIVLLPLSTIVLGASGISWNELLTILSSNRSLAALKLSLLTSFVAALVNSVAGIIVGWVLVRYDFPGRRILDALIDLPFALPTAVAGIALTTLYAPKGALGAPLAALGIEVAFAPLGIIVALIFVGLPFVVRTVQPVIEELQLEVEEAAATLGANRWTTIRSVVAPVVLPALMTGFSLSLARGLGEYGSVVFISGNLPLQTEVLPLVIMGRLERFDYHGAIVLAGVMLSLSFLLLLLINILQSRVGAMRSRSR
jgi:sulfate transport system permease protein